jgi:spermidine synthase
MGPSPTTTGEDRGASLLLLMSVFVLAVCGLVYELVAGTLSSYLLGDSVTQFSLVIGVFLAAMGIGSYASRFVRRRLLARFVLVEILIGLIGGLAAPAALAAFAHTGLYVSALLGLVLAIGSLIGLEVPLVIRILRQERSLRISVANVLSFDYLGALAAAVLFPFALLPYLGLARAGLAMGLVNVAVAMLLLYRLGGAIGPRRGLWAAAAAAFVVLAAVFAGAGRLVTWLEASLYQDEIILARETRRQRLVITRWREDLRLYLNGHLQFSTVDEYRYHEALVHPAISLADRRAEVLILGGGDGLAAREALKHPEVRRIDLVDIDPDVTGLFRDNPALSRINGGSLGRPEVTVHNLDAMKYLQDSDRFYDVVLVDLPDPSDADMAKLYSRSFFELAGRRLARGGMLACQATSPFLSREAFWCIVHTVDAARWGPGHADRLHARPYHTHVPTFGTWGFVLAGHDPPPVERIRLDVPTRYLTPALVPTLFVFPADMDRVETPVSRLDDPVVARLYRHGYHKYLD